MATYLDKILSWHRERAHADSRSLEVLLRKVEGCPPTRSFRASLSLKSRGSERCSTELRDNTESGGSTDSRDITELRGSTESADNTTGTAEIISVIAEIKRRTPSKGDLRASMNRPSVDAAALACSYQEGGARCLSVLTDKYWFDGSEDDLQHARSATELPVLRKDFTVDARDVVDAKIMGADCVLLIVAALSDAQLDEFFCLASSIGLDVLVEVHDEAELHRALDIGANIVGVNQRDLATFNVDRSRAVRIAELIPEGVIRVAESGIRDPQDVQMLAKASYHAVLVGEMLVRSSDPVAAVQALRNGQAGEAPHVSV